MNEEFTVIDTAAPPSTTVNVVALLQLLKLLLQLTYFSTS